MTNLLPILTGARFRKRDLRPTGLRFLMMHFTGWRDGRRTIRCGAFGGSDAAHVWRCPDGRWSWSVRLHAGHPTQEGAFVSGIDVTETVDAAQAARDAADAAILSWFRERIADGSVIYPWPPVEQEQPALFGGGR